MFLFPRRAVAQQPGKSHRKDPGHDARHDQRMGHLAQGLNGQTASACARKAAQRPESVAGRHDRPPPRAFDRHGIGVHRHIHATDQPAKDQNSGGDRPCRRGQRNPDQARREQHRRQPDRMGRPAPRHQGAKDRHQADRPHPKRQHQKPRYGFADAQPRHHRGQLGRPAADHQAVREKQRRHGPACPDPDTIRHHGLIFFTEISRGSPRNGDGGSAPCLTTSTARPDPGGDGRRQRS